MKRKWGKAIIEVQRFVPQEYCVQCQAPIKYTLRGLPGASGYANVGWNNIRIDWGNYGSISSNYKFDSGEDKPFSPRDYTQQLTEGQFRVIPSSMTWQLINGKTDGGDYRTSGNYLPYTGTLYMVGNARAAYTIIEKSSSN